MPAYLYRARDKTGKLLEGRIEAQSEQEAAAILRRGEVFITSLEEEKARKATLKREITLGRKKVELQDLAVFARGISTMLEAGVPLLQALRSMADQSTNKYLAEVVGEVAQKVARGYSFYQALADYPQVFNRVFVGMVQSGESGGNLDWSLQRLADYLEWEKDLRDKIQ
ncbi:MAG TPA: type II secretion system F family protein, partial [Candidatus Atribacteria bacterium]|nr:type II secretion system F family protein [Candidatus Atribacteria bacterium]